MLTKERMDEIERRIHIANTEMFKKTGISGADYIIFVGDIAKEFLDQFPGVEGGIIRHRFPFVWIHSEEEDTVTLVRRGRYHIYTLVKRPIANSEWVGLNELPEWIKVPTKERLPNMVTEINLREIV